MKPLLSQIRPCLFWSKHRNCYYVSSSRAFLLLFLGCTSSFILTDCNHHNHAQTPHRVAENDNIGELYHIPSQPILESLQSTLLIARDTKHTWDHARSYSTSADVYYQSHGKLPLPRKTHASLLDLIQADTRCQGQATLPLNSTSSNSGIARGILIIGDVHGCLHELTSLVDKAFEYNHKIPFRSIILVGDICNKGPFSARVIDYVLKQRHWYSVRGNHEDGALAAALGDSSRRKKKKYQWIIDTKTGSLEDGHIEWMADLPYTITIPFSFLEQDSSGNNKTGSKQLNGDVVVVHAGFLPHLDIEKQDIETMITIRDVETKGGLDEYQDPRRYDEEMGRATSHYHTKPWASVWHGKQVIFGHDAKRGLQIHTNAIGVDTGACYGKHLTGIILPSQMIVSVPSKKNYAQSDKHLVS